MPIRDPERRRQNHARYMREVWYPKNRQKHIQINQARKDRIGTFVNSFKNGCSCLYCPESDPVCLEFHHRVPDEKKFEISRAKQLGLNQEQIAAEIAKCDLVCANCHRKLHKGSLQRIATTGLRGGVQSIEVS